MTGLPGGRAPSRVLVIQLRRIGDVVLTTPLLDAVRETWPGARLAFLTAPPASDLFAGDDRLDALWVLRARDRAPGLARRLRAEHFDLVLDPQSLPLTALLSLASGGYRVGFRRRARSFAYHRAVDHDEHRGTDYAADHKLDLLRALGIDPRLAPPRLPGPATVHPVWAGAGDRPRVLLAPVSPRLYKRWSPAAFAATARELAATTGAFTVLAGGPGEEDQLAAAAGPGVAERVVARSLPEFAALIAGADVMVGNDNGPRHVGIALGVPTVAWFGPQNPGHWTPPGDARHAVVLDHERRPTALRGDLVRVAATPPAVAAAAADRLNTGRTARQARESSASLTAASR